MNNRNTIDQFLKYAIGGAAILGAAYLVNKAFEETPESNYTISESNRTEKYEGLYFESKKPNMMMFDPLSNEVWSLYTAQKESLSDFNHKLRIRSDLIEVMDEPNLEIFGSTLTGFALANSDLDICIPSSISLNRDERYQKLVRNYEDLIRKSCFFESVMTLKAGIPIIKGKHHSEISVDISFKEPNRPSTYLLRMYNMADWRVAPLVVTVKHWSFCNHINGAVGGLLSSYGLTLMVIFFLQLKLVVPCLLEKGDFQLMSNVDYSKSLCPTFQSSSNSTLGQLFLDFLEFYSNFDFDKYAISIRKKQPSPKPSAHPIYIESPFNQYQNNVAAAIKYNNFSTIKHVFKNSYSKLSSTGRIKNIL